MTQQKRRLVGDIEIIEVINDPQKATILLLHGFGADASDLFSISSVYQGANWVFPRAPLEIPFSPGYIGYAWFPVNMPLLVDAMREKRFDQITAAFPSTIDKVREKIDQLIIDLQIPRTDLIVGGFSQGAVLAIETALRGSEPVRGLLIFSGTLIHPTNWGQLAPLHRQTTFFQSHGTDDPLLPLERAEALSDLLKQSGLKGEFHRFRGGHEIPPSVLNQLHFYLKELI